MPKLALYYFSSCPYCRMVLDVIERMDIDIDMHDIHLEEGARDELIRIGGKGQVPCLVIDGKPLYESGDIISWLETNTNG